MTAVRKPSSDVAQLTPNVWYLPPVSICWPATRKEKGTHIAVAKRGNPAPKPERRNVFAAMALLAYIKYTSMM